jgi:hypothetical protein
MLSEQRLVDAADAVVVVRHNMRETSATAPLLVAATSARFITALSLRKVKVISCPDSEHVGSDNPVDSLDGLFDEDCEPVVKKAAVAKESPVPKKAAVAKKASVGGARKPNRKRSACKA